MEVSKVILIWATYFLLLEICASYVISNSTCGSNYPYSKCYNEYKLLRIFTADDNDMEFINENLMNEIDLDIWSYPTADANGKNLHFDIMVSPKKYEIMRNIFLKNQINSTILHPNVNDLILQEVEMTQKSRLRRRRREDGHRMTWTDYHSLDDIYSFFDYLAERYKGYVSVEDIGLSHEKRKMKVLKVCKGRGGCGKKPAIWIDGGMHAREWISPASVTYIVKKLLDDDKSKFTNRNLVENLDWYFLAVANPDGYEWSRTEDRLWRKNRGKTPVETCVGIDLNRNFDFYWNNSGGASAAGCSGYYRGDKPFSEPESQNIESFVRKRKKEIKFFNTMHSFKQAVVLPWGIKKLKQPKSFDKMEEFVQKAVDVMQEVNGNEYRVGCTHCVLYESSGISLDWAHGKVGIPYSMSVELPPRFGGEGAFILPPRKIKKIGEEIWAFHKKAAEMIIDEFNSS